MLRRDAFMVGDALFILRDVRLFNSPMGTPVCELTVTE